jgi:2-C-methyl-D-erythritol 2,4-cyclodiphosphate synthase
VAELLGVPSDCVGLKAKTPEGLNLENAAIAHVVVLLEKKATDDTVAGGLRLGKTRKANERLKKISKPHR